MDSGVRAVDFVDNHNDLVPQLQRFLQHKAGLRHGAFRRVYQQQNAVDHFENALHLAAKVGVTRGVYDIDFGVFITNGGVFRQNSNAALPLQISRVHNAIHNRLIFPINTALLQHFVHQGCLTVVNVGNNCNIPNIFLASHRLFAPFAFSNYTRNDKIYHIHKKNAISLGKKEKFRDTKV